MGLSLSRFICMVTIVFSLSWHWPVFELKLPKICTRRFEWQFRHLHTCVKFVWLTCNSRLASWSGLLVLSVWWSSSHESQECILLPFLTRNKDQQSDRSVFSVKHVRDTSQWRCYHGPETWKTRRQPRCSCRTNDHWRWPWRSGNRGRSWEMGKEARFHALVYWLCSGSWKCLEVSILVLWEWWRYVSVYKIRLSISVLTEQFLNNDILMWSYIALYCVRSESLQTKSFRSGYLAPYSRTGNIIFEACLFWFMA